MKGGRRERKNRKVAQEGKGDGEGRGEDGGVKRREKGKGWWESGGREAGEVTGDVSWEGGEEEEVRG